MSIYTKMKGTDRPVVCLDSDGEPLDVYQCAADAELIAEDLAENDIIKVCRGNSEINSKYGWSWYDPDKHGTYYQIFRNLYIDLDDAGREVTEEE